MPPKKGTKHGSRIDTVFIVLLLPGRKDQTPTHTGRKTLWYRKRGEYQPPNKLLQKLPAASSRAKNGENRLAGGLARRVATTDNGDFFVAWELRTPAAGKPAG